jgi:hypothetical protein
VLNRPNRRPIASTPIVVQAPRAPAPKKDGKLPEWASFTVLVTAVTVFAFAASGFYVFALTERLGVPLAVYFSPTDYLRITPSWATSTLGFLALALLCFALWYLAMHLWPFPGVPKYLMPRTIAWQAVFDFLPTMAKYSLKRFLIFVVPAVWIPAIFVHKVFGNTFGDIWNVFLGSAILLWYFFVAVSFYPGNAAIKALLIAIIWSSIFAAGIGAFVKPGEIELSPRTRVLYESEKDKVDNVEGKVIFDLERYLLLFTYSKSVVAIPHEKIREIETPPLPVEQKPTPAVASPTPAQTSPKPTETAHVSATPVQSPTATAEPQKK